MLEESIMRNMDVKDMFCILVDPQGSEYLKVGQFAWALQKKKKDM